VRDKKNKIPLFQRLRYLLFLGVAAKMLVDTSMQIFNPFLVIIGSGVGIGTIAMGRLVALRSLMGLTAPVLGNLADKIGYKSVIRMSLVLNGIGMILAALSGNIFIFGFALVLSGIGQIGYTPNLHAYLSSRLPYKKRAMGLGIVEYSWALAGILGLFLSGLLIDAFSWKTPFFILGGGLLVMALIYGTLPKSDSASQTRSINVDSSEKTGSHKPFKLKRLLAKMSDFFNLGDHPVSAWANIAVSGCNMFAMMHLIIIHGAWLKDEYGLGASKLGFVALLLGVADLISSVTVSLAVDKIGKRRSVTIGVAVMVAGFILFPFLNRSLSLAILSIIIPRAGFEFAVVSNFPLLSEQVPEQRGKVLGLGMTFGLIGTTIAGLTGPTAYLKFGVWGLGPVSLAASLVSLVLLVFVVKERPHSMDRDRIDYSPL
jgi:predicted MFS family arabinose efflux permease